MMNYTFPLPVKKFIPKLDYKEYKKICKSNKIEYITSELYEQLINNAPDIKDIYKVNFNTYSDYKSFCFDNSLYILIEQHWNEVVNNRMCIECCLRLDRVCEFYYEYYKQNETGEIISLDSFCHEVDSYNIHYLLFLGLYGLNLIYDKYVNIKTDYESLESKQEKILSRLRELDPHGNIISWYSIDSLETLQEKLALEEQYDKDFRYVVKHHKRYLFHLILGTVLCMSVCFWMPFIFGFLRNLCSCDSFAPKDFLSNCASGGFYVCAWLYFTGIITVPLSIFGSVTIWPLFLRKLMFYDYQDNEFHKDAYYPEILEMLKCGNIETTNAIAVLGSQLL